MDSNMKYCRRSRTLLKFCYGAPQAVGLVGELVPRPPRSGGTGARGSAPGLIHAPKAAMVKCVIPNTIMIPSPWTLRLAMVPVGPDIGLRKIPLAPGGSHFPTYDWCPCWLCHF